MLVLWNRPNMECKNVCTCVYLVQVRLYLLNAHYLRGAPRPGAIFCVCKYFWMLANYMYIYIYIYIYI